MEQGFRENQKRFRVAVGILIHNGRVLIGCRPEGVRLARYWEFPGGKIETRETPEACAVRELREEIGIDVECVEPLSVVHHADADADVEIHPFLCRIAGGETAPPPAVQANACSELRWVEPSALRHHRFPPANEAILRELEQRLRDR